MPITLPPNDEKAEQAVIGSMLIDPNGIRIARDILNPEFFYQEKNREIFSAILTLNAKNVGIDIITVKDELSKNKKDHTAHIANCMDAVATVDHVIHYAKIVARHYYHRETINFCRALAIENDPKYLEKIREMVMAQEHLGAPEIFNYKTGLFQVLDDFSKTDKSILYPTHFAPLDNSWYGCKPGEINTWGAATNVGKSVLMVNMLHRAARAGTRCLYVGTEMSAAETVHRHLAIVSGVPAWKIRIPKLTEIELTEVRNGMADKMYEMPIAILDLPEPNLSEIEAAMGLYKPEVVFLDYLERFTMPREESLRLKIREFMRGLKTMSRRRGVVIHLAAQLSRKAYGDADARPTMAELSESSAIEKESDRVCILWRQRSRQTLENKAIIECSVHKNRHGRKDLVFDFELDETNLRMEAK